MDTAELLSRMLTTYENCDLIPRCAWCKRIAIEGEWFLVTPAALTVIDAPRALSHSICPQCDAASLTSVVTTSAA